MTGEVKKKTKIMRPKKAQKKNIRIQIGLTESDLQSLRSDAADILSNVSEVMRLLLFNKPVITYSEETAGVFRDVAAVSSNLSQIASMKNLGDHLSKSQTIRLKETIDALNFSIEGEVRVMKMYEEDGNLYRIKPEWFSDAKSRSRDNRRNHRWKIGLSVSERKRLLRHAAIYKLPLPTYIYRVITNRPLRIITPSVSEYFSRLASEGTEVNKIAGMYNLTRRLSPGEVENLMGIIKRIDIELEKEVKYLNDRNDGEIQ